MRRSLLLAAMATLLIPTSQAGAVIGGVPASEEYPWMAALASGGDQFCGGSLVRPDWVLTAAHCPEGEDVEKLSVILGRHELSSSEGEEIPVTKVIIHEKYATDPNGGHDIALLQLERPATKTPVRIVSQDEGALYAPGRPARVIGWGSSVFLVGPGSDDLQEVDVPMVSDEECDTSYNGLSPFTFDPATMVCAGERMGLKDSCQGDSGGPLVVKDGAGAWTQVGTVSFGLGCGFPIYYGVYGRVGGEVLNRWLTARLPAASGTTAGTAPASGGGGAPAPEPAPAPESNPRPSTAPRSVTLSARWSLGSARRAKRSRTIRLRVTSSSRVRGLKVDLIRGGRRVATGRLKVLDGGATVKLRVRRGVRAGAFLLRMSATDAGGRPVRRMLVARLKR